MEEHTVLIDQLLEEHTAIKQQIQTLEKVGNDVEALAGLDEIKGDFMPGRLDQSQSLKRLQDLLDKISRGLEKHFNREETGLLAAFEKYGDKELAAGLRSLLLEHEGLRNRLAYSQKHVAELTDAGLSRHLWEASAHDMRAYLSHTRKLIEAHAETEQKLFRKLKRQLPGNAEGERS